MKRENVTVLGTLVVLNVLFWIVIPPLVDDWSPWVDVHQHMRKLPLESITFVEWKRSYPDDQTKLIVTWRMPDDREVIEEVKRAMEFSGARGRRPRYDTLTIHYREEGVPKSTRTLFNWADCENTIGREVCTALSRGLVSKGLRGTYRAL